MVGQLRAWQRQRRQDLGLGPPSYDAAEAATSARGSGGGNDGSDGGNGSGGGGADTEADAPR
jgi:hypothetical protein